MSNGDLRGTSALWNPKVSRQYKKRQGRGDMKKNGTYREPSFVVARPYQQSTCPNNEVGYQSSFDCYYYNYYVIDLIDTVAMTTSTTDETRARKESDRTGEGSRGRWEGGLGDG